MQESMARHSAVKVRNQHILRYIQPMTAQPAVDGVTAVVGRKGKQRVMLRPVLLDEPGKAVEGRGVVPQRLQRLRRLRGEAMHCCIVIAVVNHD